MRLGIFLLACLLAPPAEAAFFRFLGSRSFPDQAGSMIQMPVGTSVEIKDLKADPLVFSYLDPVDRSQHTLRIPRAELRTFFEGDAASFRAYFQPTFDALGALNGGTWAQSCSDLPSPESNCILHGSENDTRRATLSNLLITCRPDPNPPVVKRNDTLPVEDYRRACAEGKAPGATGANDWPAPIPHPDCNPDQARILRANEQRKHEAFLAACPLKEPSLANIGLVPEPPCMLPASEAKIKKIVLHASEGSPVAAPGALFCDYAKGGFNDLPYHFYIARDRETGRWKIFEGRSLRYQGGHVRANLNSDSIGIAIAGDYHPGGPTPAHPFAKSEAPPAEAVQLAQSLIGKLKRQYPAISNIQGHGEALFEGDRCHKDCPGPGCQFLVHRLRDKFFGGKP